MAKFKAPQITPLMIDMLEQVGEQLGRLSERSSGQCGLDLRRISRARTIHGSLQMDGNTLSLEQVSAVLDGKLELVAPNNLQEIHNTVKAYDCLNVWMPDSQADLLEAHTVMMQELLDDSGQYRSGFVRVKKSESIVYIAPPAHVVNKLMSELFKFISKLELHPLFKSCIFHYEFEYIHPFSDGNGRLGRLWQTLILSKWKPLFQDIPVESFIWEHQQEYYDAFAQSNKDKHSGAFIEFMLKTIFETISTINSPEQPPVKEVFETPVVMLTEKQLMGVENQAEKPPVKPPVGRLLDLLNKNVELGNLEILTLLHLKDRRRMRESYIKPAMELGLIEYTVPDKPTSRNQKYRLTSKGKEC